MGPHKYFLHTSHILPKYSPYYYPTWALSQILPIIFHILSNLGSHSNTSHTTTKIGPQKYTISTKNPKSFTLWARSKIPTKLYLQSPLLHGTPKVHCYPSPLKARCYMKFLQSPLLHGTLTKSITTRQYFYKISNYFQKNPNNNLAPIYKSLNNILASIYKSPNTILATLTKDPIPFYQKTKNYWANNYSTKAQILFGINDYIMLKTKKYSLAKTYFHILQSLTHGNKEQQQGPS